MAKTIRIEDETHAELVKIRGELQAKTGKDKTLDDAIQELLKISKQVKRQK